MSTATRRIPLKDLSRLIAGRLDELVQGVAVMLAKEIQVGGKHGPGTPVGNPSLWQRPAPKGYVGGYARQAWVAALNGLPGPGAAGAAPVEVALQVKIGTTFTMANYAPYIRRLEFDSWSSQAPDGFVRPVERATQQIVNEVAAHLRNR
jgi:hypothetical protein